MPVLRRLFVSRVLPASLVAIVTSVLSVSVAACSNSSSAGGFGGGGGGTGTATYCEALTAWNQACGSSDEATTASCDANLVSGCTSYTSVMNPALLAAAAECLSNNVDCDVTPTGCLLGAATNLAPTAAQTQLENTYCSNCQASGADDCEESFFSNDGPVSDVGTEIIPYSDAVAGQMGACASGSSCSSTFVQCAENVITTALGANPAAGNCIIQAFAAPKSSGSGADASTGSSDAASSADATGGDGSSGSDGGASQGDGGTGEDGGTGSTCGDHYEPNNTPDTAATLAELDDSAGTVTISAFISEPGEDQDWYTYLGNDAFNFTTAADPYVSVDAKAPMVACVWARETGGYMISSPACTAGTLTPFPGVPGYIGCCTNGGTTAQIKDYGRDGKDDSSQVVMSVTMSASAQMCVAYNLTYAFKN